MYNEIKNKMLKTLPKDQLDFAEFTETDNLIMLYFISKTERLMCTLYDKSKNKIYTFSVA